jgi:hypothetical protein
MNKHALIRGEMPDAPQALDGSESCAPHPRAKWTALAHHAGARSVERPAVPHRLSIARSPCLPKCPRKTEMRCGARQRSRQARPRSELELFIPADSPFKPSGLVRRLRKPLRRRHGIALGTTRAASVLRNARGMRNKDESFSR